MRVGRGFSLIELLIVIAIIAILAGLCFPVFSRAREKGRTTACASNLKQIYLAAEMYSQDHDGLLPPAMADAPLTPPYPPPTGFDVRLSWFTRMSPYLQNREVLACKEARKAFDAPYQGNLYGGLQVNYGQHEVFDYLAGIDAVADPAGLPLYADSTIHRFYRTANGQARVAYANAPWPVFPTPELRADAVGHERHSGGSNLCYCDGHVKWQPAPKIMEDWPFPNG